MSKIIKLSYLSPNIQPTVKYTTGEKILISGNNNFSGEYYITSVEYENDFRDILISIDCEKPNICIPEPLIGNKLFPYDNIFSITSFDKTLSYSNFGWSIDMNKSGSGIIIGAPKTDKILDYPRKNVGIAWYYAKYKDSWRKYEFKSPKITNFGEFGKSVAVNDKNLIAIGEPFYSSINNYTELPFNYGHGAVHLYSFENNDFPSSQFLRTLSGNGIKFSQFGYSIDLNNEGNILVVGAPTDINANITGGKVYLYRDINGSGLWQLSHTLTGSNNFGYFGKCVKINSGNLIIVAENQYFHIYSYNNNTLTKTHTFNLDYDNFQNSYNYNFNKFIDVDIEGNNILIGNPYHKTGIAKLYRKNLNNWNNIFSATGNSGVTYFGASVGLNINTNDIYIGSPKENFIYAYTGSSFIFSGKIGYNRSGCFSSFSGLGNSIAVDKNSKLLAIGGYLSKINIDSGSNGAVFLRNEKELCNNSKCGINDLGLKSFVSFDDPSFIWVQSTGGSNAFKKGLARILDPSADDVFIGKNLENANPYCGTIIWDGEQNGTVFQNNDTIKFNYDFNRFNLNKEYKIEILNNFEFSGNYSGQVLIIRDCNNV